jgi:hypothetical protein
MILDLKFYFNFEYKPLILKTQKLEGKLLIFKNFY